MENKIETIRKERENIINEYKSKDVPKTNIDQMINKETDLQQVVVKEIIEEAPDIKSFILIPNKEKGTKELEPFKAGQYICIHVEIDGIKTTRAYSLSSSPKDVEKGFYRITVKKAKNGYVSKYLIEEVKEGDAFTISKPSGSFGYNSIRDEENVIAIAGGVGITPFMSLAKAIKEGIETCHLTVIYSTQIYDSIIFKKEIEEINRTSKNVSFVITLTQEEKKDYHHGYIDADFISPYIKEFNTILMCGPKSIYQAMNEVLLSFDIPRKSVHYENFSMDYTPDEVKTYKLRILNKGEVEVVPCKSNETLLVSMEKAGVNAPSMCRVGECGFCRSILIEGKIKMIGAIQARDLSENDYIHPCVTYPESDIVIKLDI